MVILEYDTTFARLNTCFLLDDGKTLRCRVSRDDQPEIVFDVGIRRRRPRDNSVYIGPTRADLDIWTTDTFVPRPLYATTDDAAAPIQLQVIKVPEHVQHVLLSL